MPEPSLAMMAVLRGSTTANWVNTSGEPASIAASAGVVLPPKPKSALPPVTACSEGAWLGKGPIHSTLMPSRASCFAKSPRTLASSGRPPRPQPRRTVSVLRPGLRLALWAWTGSTAAAPAPIRAACTRLQREGENEASKGMVGPGESKEIQG